MLFNLDVSIQTITGIVSLLTVLSYFLSLNEYYTKKAYWDYFHIHENCRSGMRSGFHAEYLSYSIIVSALIIMVEKTINLLLKNVNEPMPVYCIICVVLFWIIMFVLWGITKKFSLSDANERKVWESVQEYRGYITKRFCLFAIEYGFVYLVCVIFLYLFTIWKDYMLLLIPMVCIFVFMQVCNYSIRQQMILCQKYFDIITIDGQLYVALECVDGLYQLNVCEYDKALKKLTINLDCFIMYRKNRMDFNTVYVNKFNRKCNGEICKEHSRLFEKISRE